VLIKKKDKTKISVTSRGIDELNVIEISRKYLALHIIVQITDGFFVLCRTNNVKCTKCL
jgi:hypothetical protein